MTEVATRFVSVNGHQARILEKGSGSVVGYLGGLAGVPQWTPFLEALSREHRVVCPSLPGFPGAQGHEELDSLIDWVSATLDLIEAAGLSGCDLAGNSVGAMLALEVAALSPESVGRLALMAPLGLYDEAVPVPHIWARRSADMAALLCTRTDELARLQVVPEGEDAVEWNLEQARDSSGRHATWDWPSACTASVTARFLSGAQATASWRRRTWV